MLVPINRALIDTLKATLGSMEEEFDELDYDNVTGDDVRTLTALLLQYSQIIIDMGEDNLKLSSEQTKPYNQNIYGH